MLAARWSDGRAPESATALEIAHDTFHTDAVQPGVSIYPEIMRRAVQLEFSRHGGPRRGAGRPRGNRVSHAARERFEKPMPVLVTLRVHATVWNLRSSRAFRCIRRCLKRARGRFGARLIEFSVLGNHLHLILEADSDAALSRAMQGICIPIARALNAMMERAGAVFSDHYTRGSCALPGSWSMPSPPCCRTPHATSTRPASTCARPRRSGGCWIPRRDGCCVRGGFVRNASLIGCAH
jgi:hypothetical protein